MDLKEMTNEELSKLANEMLPKVSALGDFVGQAFPEKSAGLAVAECVSVLQSCMSVLTERANIARTQAEEIVIDLQEAPKTDSLNVIKDLAVKDCVATFKALEALRSKDSLDDLQLRTMELLGTHAVLIVPQVLALTKATTNE